MMKFGQWFRGQAGEMWRIMLGLAWRLNESILLSSHSYLRQKHLEVHLHKQLVRTTCSHFRVSCHHDLRVKSGRYI